LVCRSKDDVLLFFKGAGVSDDITIDLETRVRNDRANINKYEIARTVLARLNQKGEATLRERREILKRITEFESFSACWESDQLKAKGLVAEIRQVVNIKDSFTRMNIEREKESQNRRTEREAKIAGIQKRKGELSLVKSELSGLFAETNVYKRGKKVEDVLNRLFKASDILIREAFTLRGNEGKGIVEQIDGVVEIDGNFYLVEMKWWNEPLGIGEVSQHLVRIYHRGHARGIFISASEYTESAVTTCREALSRTTIVLCLLEEIVRMLEDEGDMKSLLRAKIQAAIIDKNPLYRT
jgi:hypothetical protein